MANSVQKDGSILINDFSGIGLSPITGFGDSRNLDIFTEPGAVRLNLATIKRSSTTITGLPKWIVQDPTDGTYYCLDSSGKVYSSSTGVTWAQVTGNTTTNSSGNGLALFVASDGDRFLIVARDTILDVYDIVGTTWTNGWQTGLNSNTYHPIKVGQDNIIYIGHGNLIASIQELTAFAPGTGATYTYASSALDLPKEYAIRCLEELGQNLMIGTTMTNAVAAVIFPWDRVSSSFRFPLRIQDDGVKAMVVANNNLYIITGRQGNIHISDGTFVKFIRSLPYANYGFWNGENVDVMPGAIIKSENQIFFGVSTGSTGTGYGPYGVYGLTLDGQTLTFEWQVSSGEVTNTTTIQIGALFPSNYILIGWKGASAQGIDQVDTSNNYYASYTGSFDTELFPIGQQVNKKTYQYIDILLVKPLTSSTGVRVKYRKNLTDSFSSAVATFDFTTYGAVSSINLPFSVADVDQLQLRVELTSPGTGTPEVRQILIR